MSNYDERSQSSSGSQLPKQRKRLGGYLVEAGLLTPAQVSVALNDQKITGMRFGEILAARGWVKQQTIEYLMRKVIIPEQKAIETKAKQAAKDTYPGNGGKVQADSTAATSGMNSKARSNAPLDNGIRREPPITKPLPSYGASDDNDGVSWVG